MTCLGQETGLFPLPFIVSLLKQQRLEKQIRPWCCIHVLCDTEGREDLVQSDSAGYRKVITWVQLSYTLCSVCILQVEGKNNHKETAASTTIFRKKINETANTWVFISSSNYTVNILHIKMHIFC